MTRWSRILLVALLAVAVTDPAFAAKKKKKKRKKKDAVEQTAAPADAAPLPSAAEPTAVTADPAAPAAAPADAAATPAPDATAATPPVEAAPAPTAEVAPATQPAVADLAPASQPAIVELAPASQPAISPVVAPPARVAAKSTAGGVEMKYSPGDEDVHRRFGFMLDAGVPDAAMLSVAYRPFYWLRLHGGGGYNMISPGIRAGLSLIPFYTWLTPSLTLEAGRFFPGDANKLLELAGVEDHYTVLEKVGYDFANAHVGLEFGKKYFTFYLRGGMSYMKMPIKGLNETIAENLDPGDPGIRLNGDPTITAKFPSIRLGFIIYFMQ